MTEPPEQTITCPHLPSEHGSYHLPLGPSAWFDCCGDCVVRLDAEMGRQHDEGIVFSDEELEDYNSGRFMVAAGSYEPEPVDAALEESRPLGAINPAPPETPAEWLKRGGWEEKPVDLDRLIRECRAAVTAMTPGELLEHQREPRCGECGVIGRDNCSEHGTEVTT